MRIFDHIVLPRRGRRNACTAWLLCAMVVCTASVHAEQMQVVDGFEIHYIIIPTTFLKPHIANTYELPRGKDRALINVSVLDPEGVPVEAGIEGTTRNLLGQVQTLAFKQVREQQAIYYLAVLRHSNEEHHRLSLSVTLPSGTTSTIEFAQKLYWEE